GATLVDPADKPEVITHTLDFSEQGPDNGPKAKADQNELVPTTQYIRNFNVFYQEVVPENVEDEFIIVEAQEILDKIEVVAEEVTPSPQEDQFALSFDMPLGNRPGDKAAVEEREQEGEHTVTFNLDDGNGDVKVNDYEEVTPVLEYNKSGETRYNLEEYMELESQLTGAKSMARPKETKVVEEELAFEKKTLTIEASQEKEGPA